MICPLSAVEGKNGFLEKKADERLPGDRSGESDDETRDHTASVCKEAQLDRGSRDNGVELPAFEAGKGELREGRFQRVVRFAAWERESAADTCGDGGGSAAAVPGGVFRLQCEAFSREAGREAFDQAELYVGEEPAAGIGAGGEGEASEKAPEKAGEKADAWDDAAPRRLASSVVRRRLAMSRSRGDTG